MTDLMVFLGVIAAELLLLLMAIVKQNGSMKKSLEVSLLRSEDRLRKRLANFNPEKGGSPRTASQDKRQGALDAANALVAHLEEERDLDD